MKAITITVFKYFFRPCRLVRKWFNERSLVTLVLISPAGKKVSARFKKQVLLETVRQSIALQSHIQKNRISLTRSGKKLNLDATLEHNKLSNKDCLNWSVTSARRKNIINQKVFCIGLFKTGTTSMARALSLLGYRSYGTFGERFVVSWEDYWNVDDTVAFHPYFEEIKRFVKDYDGFSDAPWMYLYKELDQWFPGSKFVLTTRDAESLADSEINQCIRYGSKPEPRSRYIRRYNRHNKNVVNYFKYRPQDLLIYDVKTGWPDLCKFLGAEVPMTSFPHENKRPVLDSRS